MRILIYGAGVIGSLYAMRLHDTGHRVVVLGRGERLDEIRNDGLILEDVRSHRRDVARVDVIETLDPHDPYDLVLVPVRLEQLPAVLPPLAHTMLAPGYEPTYSREADPFWSVG
jgi:2-dehydropantoate 2-reductase